MGGVLTYSDGGAHAARDGSSWTSSRATQRLKGIYPFPSCHVSKNSRSVTTTTHCHWRYPNRGDQRLSKTPPSPDRGDRRLLQTPPSLSHGDRRVSQTPPSLNQGDQRLSPTPPIPNRVGHLLSKTPSSLNQGDQRLSQTPPIPNRGGHRLSKTPPILNAARHQISPSAWRYGSHEERSSGLQHIRRIWTRVGPRSRPFRLLLRQTHWTFPGCIKRSPHGVGCTRWRWSGK